MANIIIACLGRRPVASMRYIFSDGTRLVLLMFLNKAFITARLAQDPSAPSAVERAGFWNHDFLISECTTGHPPLCLCVTVTVVTYRTFRDGRKGRTPSDTRVA